MYRLIPALVGSLVLVHGPLGRGDDQTADQAGREPPRLRLRPPPVGRTASQAGHRPGGK